MAIRAIIDSWILLVVGNSLSYKSPRNKRLILNPSADDLSYVGGVHALHRTIRA